MISRQGRKQADELLRDFRDGNITNDQFEDAWPQSEEDRKDPALSAIAATIWGCYSDTRRHRLTGRHALTEEWRGLFDRCALFLNGDLEYEWPPGRLAVGGSNGTTTLFFLLVFGILALLNRRPEKSYVLDASAGDSRVWPFIRRSDYDRARGAPASEAIPSPAPSWISSQRLRIIPPP